ILMRSLTGCPEGNTTCPSIVPVPEPPEVGPAPIWGAAIAQLTSNNGIAIACKGTQLPPRGKKLERRLCRGPTEAAHKSPRGLQPARISAGHYILPFNTVACSKRDGWVFSPVL